MTIDLPPSLPPLLPGDLLLYKPQGLFGWIIALKTWHSIAHCEMYLENGIAVASREGQGVNHYHFRSNELTYVLRPVVPFDLQRALVWYLKLAYGQKYDWLGLLRFAWRAKVVPDSKDNKQFCSEFLTRLYRAGGLDPFNGADADSIAPFQFLLSDKFQTVWSIK